MVEGISHITFVVKNLEKTSILFKEIFGAKELYSSGDKKFSLSREIYFDISGHWIVIMEGEPLAERTYNHTAFKIRDEEYDKYLDKIRCLGLEIKQPRPRVEGEGRSIYFYDYDNHLFELHSGNVEERLKKYSKKK